MTVATDTAAVAAGDTPATPRAVQAPLGRMLWSEVTWVLRRPRTIVSLALLGLVPIVVAIGVLVADRGQARAPGSDGVFTSIAGNGLMLPVIALSVCLALLLPLVGAMSAADALAGEAAHGTLRALLIAPVSRVRLVGIKAFGVAAVVLTAATVIAVVGVVTGLVLVGSHGMVTFSGTSVSLGSALVRVLVATLWATVQVWAVAAVALAVSAFTEHPLVVMAVTLAGAIVFGVLSSIPSLDWLQPFLLTEGWPSILDVLRDPMPTTGLLDGVWRAGCYLLIGLSVTLARVVTKDG
ncbi:ABC transporter permease subunit [Gandjariella thermophila]|uniref:ABC transporter permease n=1 Tax=Gandjariella thermophila TaxID=1931992 RepID=A0A4D4J4F9_9PSEU|nr:ABC transporter permease subunit [Gandjariella thermophila]GDY29952.1 ABC transporter permease [Gandjariella thermophila]